MKKFLIFALAASLFAGCSKDITTEIDLNTNILKVGFELDSRVQLNENCQAVWTNGDVVSVFDADGIHRRYEFQGETGAREGVLVPVSMGWGSAETATYEVVAVYPYREDYYISRSNSTVDLILPAIQYYKNGSYGVGANLMIGTGVDRNIRLKSLCGYIKLQLTGGKKLTRITLRGNNNEIVAGSVTANYKDFTLTQSDSNAVSEITLDLGDGVQLMDTPTDFYISLIPQTFTNGITITASAADGTYITQKTSKQITVTRNTIQPMASIKYEDKIDSTTGGIFTINYTSTDGAIVKTKDVFGAGIVSNTYQDGKGKIVFNGAVTTIGEKAFMWCDNLQSIEIPEGVVEIASSAFYDCSNLQSVTIANSVTLIGSRAFEMCYKLSDVSLNSGLKIIGDSAFSSCWKLEKIDLPNTLTTIEDSAFMLSGLTELKIPSSVTEIGDSAFATVPLVHVDIPNTVKRVGRAAFRNNPSLKSIKIGSGLKHLEPYTFEECINLETISFGSNIEIIDVGVLLNSFNNFDGNLILPESVKTIGDIAFSFRYGYGSEAAVFIKSQTPPSAILISDDWQPFGSAFGAPKIYVPINSVEAYKADSYWSYYANNIIGYEYE